MEGVPLATRVVANGAMGFVVHMVKEMGVRILGQPQLRSACQDKIRATQRYMGFNHIFLQGHKKLNSLLAGSEMVFQLYVFQFSLLLMEQKGFQWILSPS